MEPSKTPDQPGMSHDGSDRGSSPGSAKKRAGLPCGCQAFAVLFIFLILANIVLGPVGGGMKKAPQSSAVQTVHALGLAMYSYANDNDGKYPEGKNSTEVFQKLMDGGYVTDTTIFYIPLPGKIKPAPDQKTLKPENVCFDVTADLTLNSPPALPLIFMTGYRISYISGGAASPLIKPYPPFGPPYLPPPGERTWTQWWHGAPEGRFMGPGLAVFYVNNSARWAFAPTEPNDYSVPKFISPDFQPDGKTYVQLTPDGPLKP